MTRSFRRRKTPRPANQPLPTIRPSLYSRRPTCNAASYLKLPRQNEMLTA